MGKFVYEPDIELGDKATKMTNLSGLIQVRHNLLI